MGLIQGRHLPLPTCTPGNGSAPVISRSRAKTESRWQRMRVPVQVRRIARCVCRSFGFGGAKNGL